MYVYTYSYGCADLVTLFSADLDMAIAYWKIVLSGRFKFLDLWCNFLNVRTVDVFVEIFFQHWALCYCVVCFYDLGTSQAVDTERHVESASGLQRCN